MRELFLVEAVNDALHVEMERDAAVMVIGEDVGRLGGVFRATAGLQDRFGADRCVDTPLAEAGILGTAVGLWHLPVPLLSGRGSLGPSPGTGSHPERVDAASGHLYT